MNKPVAPIRFEVIKSKYLVGKRINMSLSDDKTTQLWQTFMSHRKEVTNTLNSDLYSVENFACTLQALTPNTLFEKWAAVEVSDFSQIPAGLEQLVIETGLYAVFIHVGNAQSFPLTLQAIFNHWLPQSGYQYAKRPQFEIMPADYRPDDPNAIEEVWIPITK